MAQNDSVIKSLTANSYSGEYETVVNGYATEGSFNTTGDKELNNIRGSVSSNGVFVASFNAYKNGDSFRYSFSDVSDITVLMAVATAASTAIAQIQAELTPVE